MRIMAQLYVKSGVALRGRKGVDMSRELGISYQQYFRIVNGYTYPPPNFNKRVSEIFESWDRLDKLEKNLILKRRNTIETRQNRIAARQAELDRLARCEGNSR